MLSLDGNEFASSAVLYSEEDPSGRPGQSYIHIEISLDDLPPTMVRVDTAAPWVILDLEFNAHLGLKYDPSNSVLLRTRFGTKWGSLERQANDLAFIYL